MFRVQSNFVLQPVLFATAMVVGCAGLLAAYLMWGDVRESPEQPPADASSPPTVPADMPARATVVAGRIGAIGALLAASLAVPQFWYSAHYEPSNAPPIVSVETSIDNVEIRGDHVELTAQITLENKGKTPVRMLTSLYEITGTPLTYRKDPVALKDLPFDDILGGNYGSSARLSPHAEYHVPQLIQVGPVGDDYAWFGPDETFKVTLQAQVPRNQFHLLRLTAEVAVSRADRVEVEGQLQSARRDLKNCAGVRMAESRRPIAHLGAFDWLTESDRELVTFWAVSGSSDDNSPWWPAFPWTGVSIQHAGHDCGHALEPDHDGLEDRAMVGWASSVGEAAMPEEPEDKP
ncbi:hypothetical protein ACWD0A_00435 [Streptomyces sp. NPDC002867]